MIRKSMPALGSLFCPSSSLLESGLPYSPAPSPQPPSLSWTLKLFTERLLIGQEMRATSYLLNVDIARTQRHAHFRHTVKTQDV
jgi:hypothetical protein